MREGYKKGIVIRGKVKYNDEYYVKGDPIEAPAEIIDRLAQNGIVELDAAPAKLTAPQKSKPAPHPAPSSGPENNARAQEEGNPADVKINFNPDEVMVQPESKKGRNK